MGGPIHKTRDQMLRSADQLIRQQGIGATSIDDILRASNAPRGSIYHHFPQGRLQIIHEVLKATIDDITQLITQAIADNPHDPFAACNALVQETRASLLRDNFESGCVVMAATIENSQNDPQLAALVRSAFTTWTTLVSEGLRQQGISSDQARRLATLMISTTKGALLMCRAQRSLQPLDDIEYEIRWLANGVLGARNVGVDAGKNPNSPI